MRSALQVCLLIMRIYLNTPNDSWCSASLFPWYHRNFLNLRVIIFTLILFHRWFLGRKKKKDRRRCFQWNKVTGPRRRWEIWWCVSARSPPFFFKHADDITPGDRDSRRVNTTDELLTVTAFAAVNFTAEELIFLLTSHIVAGADDFSPLRRFKGMLSTIYWTTQITSQIFSDSFQVDSTTSTFDSKISFICHNESWCSAQRLPFSLWERSTWVYPNLSR